MTENEWNEYLSKSNTWRIRMSHELLRSKAYGALT